MKKRICIILFALLMTAIHAACAAPVLSGVFADDVALISGQDGWYFNFTTSEGGALAMQLLSGETGEVVADVGAAQVEAGNGSIGWNGILPDGTAAAPGSYMLAVRVRNFWGEESESGLLSLHIFSDEE